MPIYEYACEACTHKFETLQKFSEAPLSTCPACNKNSLRKLISAAAFRLKGGGWYETDFKSGDQKNIAGSDSKKNAEQSSAKGDAKGESNSDSAAAGKESKTSTEKSSKSKADTSGQSSKTKDSGKHKIDK